MLHPSLKGVWTLERIKKLFVSDPTDSESRPLEERHQARDELCALLNRLQNRPLEQITQVRILRKPEIKITFGDGSEVVLEEEKLATNFITQYILAREEYIAILEFNRAGDPRITGEFNRLQRQLKKALDILKSEGRTGLAQVIEELK